MHCIVLISDFWLLSCKRENWGGGSRQTDTSYSTNPDLYAIKNVKHVISIEKLYKQGFYFSSVRCMKEGLVVSQHKS